MSVACVRPSPTVGVTRRPPWASVGSISAPSAVTGA